MIALGAGPVLAKTTIIAELGTAPLLGSSTSTAQMRTRIARNERLVSAAAVKIGLDRSEYAAFQAAVASSHVAWVVVPRHLDAMTWQSGGTVYALHDVLIPANVYGWEVDVHSHGRILALYLPAKCGNLSLVNKAAPAVVAQRPVRVRIVAAKAPPIAVVPIPDDERVPDDAPVAPPVVVASAFPPAGAAASHRAPFFLIPLLFGFAALGGGGSHPSVVPAGCP